MGGDHESEMIHRALDTELDRPGVTIAEIVAALDETEPDELTPIWGCIDDMLDHVFSDPPAPEAQVELTFSYEGYRITVEQNGITTFVETG